MANLLSLKSQFHYCFEAVRRKDLIADAVRKLTVLTYRLDESRSPTCDLRSEREVRDRVTAWNPDAAAHKHALGKYVPRDYLFH
jgi:hypothetical protein